MKKKNTWKILSLVASLLLSMFVVSCEKEKSETVQGLFSVSDTKQVVFASGNLAEGGRSFVAHQWEYGGYFGWGTGNNPGNTSTDWEDYPEFYDWGDYIEGGWRTLSKDEWRYVLSGRTDASSKVATCSVNGVNGLILLPDNWVLPAGCSFTAGFGGGFWLFKYTSTQWQQMEAAGAVFLPAAGSRLSTRVSGEGLRGDYWSSSPNGEDDAYCITFTGSGVPGISSWPRRDGYSVRLVQDKN